MKRIILISSIFLWAGLATVSAQQAVSAQQPVTGQAISQDPASRRPNQPTPEQMASQANPGTSPATQLQPGIAQAGNIPGPGERDPKTPPAGTPEYQPATSQAMHITVPEHQSPVGPTPKDEPDGFKPD